MGITSFPETPDLRHFFPALEIAKGEPIQQRLQVDIGG
jgi:hypothetical protein